MLINNKTQNKRLIFSLCFTASVRAINMLLTCYSPELRPISFNQQAVGNWLWIKWPD